MNRHRRYLYVVVVALMAISYVSAINPDDKGDKGDKGGKGGQGGKDPLGHLDPAALTSSSGPSSPLGHQRHGDDPSSGQSGFFAPHGGEDSPPPVGTSHGSDYHSQFGSQRQMLDDETRHSRDHSDSDRGFESREGLGRGKGPEDDFLRGPQGDNPIPRGRGGYGASSSPLYEGHSEGYDRGGRHQGSPRGGFDDHHFEEDLDPQGPQGIPRGQKHQSSFSPRGQDNEDRQNPRQGHSSRFGYGNSPNSDRSSHEQDDSPPFGDHSRYGNNPPRHGGDRTKQDDRSSNPVDSTPIHFGQVAGPSGPGHFGYSSRPHSFGSNRSQKSDDDDDNNQPDPKRQRLGSGSPFGFSSQHYGKGSTLGGALPLGAGPKSVDSDPLGIPQRGSSDSSSSSSPSPSPSSPSSPSSHLTRGGN